MQAPLLVVVAVFAITLVSGVAAQPCNTCVDGSNCCGSNPTCCTLTNTTSTVCCDTTELCCGGYCCDAGSESCCFDPVQGGVCCEEQETFCCPTSAQHPNRCCPRWTVCCDNDNQDGCCAPEAINADGTLKPDWRAGVTPPGADTEAADGETSVASALASGAASEIIYVLFMEVDTVYAVHINASSGAVQSQVALQNFRNFGEMTRLFAFDGSRTLFYYLEANYTQSPRPDGTRLITLWTIDPVSGLTTSAVVSGGLYNNPTAWSYDCARDRLVVAAQNVARDGVTITGYTWAAVNPTTAVATVMATANNVGDTNEWSGWFHALARNGSVSYRNGWRNVTLQQDYGLGITAFETSSSASGGAGAIAAQSWWVDGVPLPEGHDFYQSLQTDATGAFLSLAPLNGASAGYDLVRWSPTTNSATVIASFGNAFPPPLFGPAADGVSCDASTYVAAVVHDEPDSDFDRWALAVVDVTHGDALTYLLITPLMDAKMASISGVGMPQPDASSLCRRRRGFGRR